MTKLSTYYGQGDYEDRRAIVYDMPICEKDGDGIISINNFVAQAITDSGRTTFRLGEFPTEEQAEMACEDYVLGVKYE